MRNIKGLTIALSILAVAHWIGVGVYLANEGWWFAGWYFVAGTGWSIYAGNTWLWIGRHGPKGTQ